MKVKEVSSSSNQSAQARSTPSTQRGSSSHPASGSPAAARAAGGSSPIAGRAGTSSDAGRWRTAEQASDSGPSPDAKRASDSGQSRAAERASESGSERMAAEDEVSLSAEMMDEAADEKMVGAAAGPGKPAGYRPPDDDQDGLVPTDDSNRTDRVAQQQRDSIDEALDSRDPVIFTNTEGDVSEVAVRNSTNLFDRILGNTSYQVSVNGDRFSVRFDDSLTPEQQQEALARLVDNYSQLPPHLRDAVDRIQVRQPTEQERMDGVAAFYTSYGAGDSRNSITFLGLDNLSEGTFDHEYGHALANHVGGVPRGWEQAQRGDARPGDPDNAPSGYSHTGPGEDFAESFAAYQEARQQGPEALEKFRQAFPERAEILDHIFAGDTAALQQEPDPSWWDRLRDLVPF